MNESRKRMCSVALGWIIPPVAWIGLIVALAVIWLIVEPGRLVALFDHDGRSPFELLTLPFYAAIIPMVWWLCPFAGSRRRRVIFCSAVSIVAFMAIVKELDLHLVAANWLYPDLVGESGGLLPGLFKPDGRPLRGTPFKLRVLTNPAVPIGLKAFIMSYFTLFFGVFGVGFLWLFPQWVRGVLRLEPASWSWGCCGASGVIVQVADRLPSWLNHAGRLGEKAGDSVTSATSFCVCLEEGGELMVAIFALLTIFLAHRQKGVFDTRDVT